IPWQPETAPVPSAGIRQGAVVVIVGGFGEIGMLLGERLHRLVGARLALIGRTPVPTAEALGAAGGGQETDPRQHRRLAFLRGMPEAGADVLGIAADCTDRAQMDAALSAVVGRFGRIDGVVFAAAETAAPSLSSPARDLDAAACREQFAAKAHGLIVLR